MKFSKLITTTFLLGSISLGGATAWAEDVVRYSGFVDNYPDLKPDTRGGGGMLYIKPGVDIGKYNKIMIEPIEVWLADDSKYKGFSPDDLKELTDEFYRVLEANLEPDYPVVSQPGEGVLIVRLAITDVYAKKKKRGLLGYTPMWQVPRPARTGKLPSRMQPSRRNCWMPCHWISWVCWSTSCRFQKGVLRARPGIISASHWITMQNGYGRDWMRNARIVGWRLT
jgi:hypothetical protein